MINNKIKFSLIFFLINVQTRTTENVNFYLNIGAYILLYIYLFLIELNLFSFATKLDQNSSKRKCCLLIKYYMILSKNSLLISDPKILPFFLGT